ncbi:MAG: VOC family protein [Sciscionella sp.]
MSSTGDWRENEMSIELNHTIVAARDKRRSAVFLTELFGLPEAKPAGPFLAVQVSNNVALDYADVAGEVTSQHYAFLVGEDDFESIFARIRERQLPYYADPQHRMVGEINERSGGRGLYFEDPDGHNMEIMTRSAG